MARQAKRDALSRERKRRAQATPTPSQSTPATVAATRRAAASACGWCGGAIEIRTTGRIPKWCSPACRQRAWEQSRAAASGRAAVEVVERVVEVPVERDRVPRRNEWPALLRELVAQLDTGQIYARDLPGLSAALDELLTAVRRRRSTRRLRP